MAKAKNTSKLKGKNSKKTTSKKKSRSLLGRLFKFFFVVGLWGAIALVGLLAWYAQELPDITEKAEFERKTSITIKAADGTVITRYGETSGEKIDVTTLPDHIPNAILAIEDRRFYDHFGVDLIGLTRAIVANVRHGGVVQGGSTITQQLAKNLFLTKERKLKRKIQEAMLAFWLEHQLSKDEILSSYMNRVYMGAGMYGFDAASNRYFGKSIRDVDVKEAALLAGLLKAPSRYSPSNNPVLAEKRSRVVLNSMADAGYIEKSDVNTLRASAPKPPRKPSVSSSARYFTDWIVDSLEELIGTPENDIIVTTTLNPRAQKAAHASLIKTLMAQGDAKNMSQGSVVVMGLKGEVVAMVGGRDYTLSQFNRATQATRAPGSSFKPFVFLTAMEQGWFPDSFILDAPFNKGRYRPKNFGGRYMGETDLYSALTFSLNTATVRLAKAVGIGSVIDTARTLGIESDLEPDLSLSLGSSGITLLEMTNAYAMIANGGHRIKPFGISRIESEDGTLIYDRAEQKTYDKVFHPSSIVDLKYMMRSVVENGTGRGTGVPFTAAGKTGTSQESRDALFMGFTNQVAAGVWVGNDDNSPMKGVTGGSAPAQIWGGVMRATRNMYPRTLDGGFPAPQDSSVSFFAMLNSLTGDDNDNDNDYGYRQKRGGWFGSKRRRTYSASRDTSAPSHEQQRRYNN